MKYAVILISIALLLIPRSSFCDATEDNLKSITDAIPQNWWDGGWDKRQELESFISNNPGSDALCARAQYYIGCYYYSIADYDSAIRAYDTIISAYQSQAAECARAQYEIAQIYLNCKHDPRVAGTEYNKAISYNDTQISPMSEIGIGRCYMALEDYQQAEAAFRRVLSGYPKALRQNYDAYMELGNLLMQQANVTDKAKIREALSNYKRAYQICPLEEPLRLQYTVSMIHKALKDLDGSTARANRFIKYQKYGPPGDDGSTGTADDLTDPLAEF